MTTMISEVYDALRDIGVSEEKAKSAAAAISAEHLATKDDINKINTELKIIKWMLALVIVVTVMPALKTLFS